jgi:8-oxo-dGTP diphosphatase
VVAIRIFAIDDSQRILLLRRGKAEHACGEWCLPGGKLDYGDSPEHTVAKELAEEAGLVARDVQFLFYQDSPPREPGGMHCINLYFRCAVSGPPTLNEESSEATWVAPEEALALKPVFGAVEAIRRFVGLNSA